MKKAIITGITGQDGSYLAEILLNKGYEVHGIKRRTSLINTDRIDHIYQDPNEIKNNFFLHYGEMTDFGSLLSIIQKVQPDEIYNLAAQSHVAVSFQEPEYTSDVNALGTLRILESIKTLNMINKVKFYQASSSELFGGSKEYPQNEQTKFIPKSPYAVSKLYAYWITVNYRESYGLFASNGILFNHESPRRGETFVTSKIVKGLINYKKNKKILYLGNLYAKRDWGHARDYMHAAWKLLQHHKADDFCIGSEKQYSVKEFAEIVSNKLGINIKWIGTGIDEKGVDENNNTVIAVKERYLRPSEVDNLISNTSKAKKNLSWNYNFNINDLIQEMIDFEINEK
tara:strand:- start:538 stop:1563 length:1026 start_codon:yes stop_codon:yes gene_type:complete